MVLSVLFIVAVKLNIMHFINDIVQSLFEGHNKLSYFFRKMMINQYTAESSIITFLLFILFYSTIFIFIDRKKSKILLTLVLCVELFLFFNVYSFVKINKNAVLNNNFYKKLKMLSGDDRIFFVNDFRNINDHLLYKIKSLNAYNPAMPFKFIEYIFLSNQEKLNFEYEKLSNRIGKININSAVFDMTNTRYVISPQEFSEHGYQLINKIDGYSIYKNVYAWNYVEVFSEWQVLNEKEITQNLKNLKRGEKKLFLYNMPEIKSNHENIQYKISDYVEISKDDKYLIKFNVDVCNDAVIFLPIMFDKFFEAYVNGKKTDIMRSNKIFISFPVKKGFNHIELLYNPDYSVLKFILSGILFFAAGAVIYKKTVI